MRFLSPANGVETVKMEMNVIMYVISLESENKKLS